MIKALEVPADVNLAAFSRYLNANGLAHRIAEEGVNQVVWVANEQQAVVVNEVFRRFTAGELDLDGGVEFDVAAPRVTSRLSMVMQRYPLTLILIAVNIVLFPVGMNVAEGNLGLLFHKMVFLKMEEVNGQLYFTSLAHTLSSGEVWRIVTPMFIHFSWLHIVFNLLWIWEIGRRIEMINGALLLLVVVFFSSAVSNFTQFFMSGPGLFGGMSGVVFGLLAHSLIWSRMVPTRSMAVPNGIYIFMFAYLAIGFTGAIDLLGMGKLANGAHLGGLIGGLITGAIAGLVARRRQPPPPR